MVEGFSPERLQGSAPSPYRPHKAVSTAVPSIGRDK